MSVTCKYCKTPFPDRTLMCSVCGNRLPVSAAPAPAAPTAASASRSHLQSLDNYRFDLFEGIGWAIDGLFVNEYIKERGKQLGIILTNTTGFTAHHEMTFKTNLLEYINFKAQSGTEYLLLDLANQSVIKTADTSDIEEVIDLLKKVHSELPFEYLMILGDFKTVPNAVWDNYCRDDDETVFSDLPYTTLNAMSPFFDIGYNVDTKLKVGRIPTSVKSDFQEAYTYLKNTMNSRITQSSLKAHFLTSLLWHKCSEVIAQNLPATVSPRPQFRTDFSFDGNFDGYNMLMFDLHGADFSHFWYAEDYIGNVEPTFSAPKLPKNKNYILSSSACYGARPLNGGKNKESIVNTALTNGCCVFVGSTQIAYASVDPSSVPSGADVMQKYFNENMLEGYSAGESFNDALCHLKKNSWDDSSLKTLIEFALYGDPSYAVIGSQNSNKAKTVAKAFQPYNYRTVKGIPQKAVCIKPMPLGKSIGGSVKSFVQKNHPEIADAKPDYYIDESTGDYQAIYKKKSKLSGKTQILKVYLNVGGEVKTTYHSR